MWSRHAGEYNSRGKHVVEGVLLGLRQFICLPNLDHNGKTLHYLEKIFNKYFYRRKENEVKGEGEG